MCLHLEVREKSKKVKDVTFVMIKGGRYAVAYYRSNGEDGHKKNELVQEYLGIVDNWDKLEFYHKDYGYFYYNPETKKREELKKFNFPPRIYFEDERQKAPSSIIHFGDSFFLHHLITGIGYDAVINSIDYANKDTINAMLQFYLLDNEPNSAAFDWFKTSYASFIYPNANLHKQRISEFLERIGSQTNKDIFIEKHIEFIMQIYGAENIEAVIDTSGYPTKSKTYLTRESNHNNKVSIEFRLLVVIHKKSGLPLYFEAIPGNTNDKSILGRVDRLLKKYGCDVRYYLGDAGFDYPKFIEKFVLTGKKIMLRLNPAYSLYKQSIKDNYEILDNNDNLIRFNNRLIHCIKIKSLIGKNIENNEDVYGYIYLCKDTKTAMEKKLRYESGKHFNEKTIAEIVEVEKKFGVFAIATTEDLTPIEAITEYYTRNRVENYYDYAKNYVKALPTPYRSIERLNGHLLLSFIASFLVVVVKNKLKIMDADFVYCLDSESGNYKLEENEQTVMEHLVRESPKKLFRELHGQMANVFDDEIVPSIPIKTCNDFYKAFGLQSPDTIMMKGNELTYVFDVDKPSKDIKKLVFSIKPDETDESILEKRKSKVKNQNSNSTKNEKDSKADVKKSCSKKVNQNYNKTKRNNDAQDSTNREARQPDEMSNQSTASNEFEEFDDFFEKLEDEMSKMLKRKPGRPAGRRNKSTIIKEFEEFDDFFEKLEDEMSKMFKRKPGRPIGSTKIVKNIEIMKIIDDFYDNLVSSFNKKPGRPLKYNFYGRYNNFYDTFCF